MGIDDLIKGKAASVTKDEKKIFDAYHELVDPSKQADYLDEEFLGVKGGIGKFASDLYTETSGKIESLHKKNSSSDKKKSKEELRVNALEHLVVDNLKSLKSDQRAQEWVKHFETLKKNNGFHDLEERQGTIFTMAAEVLGWNLKDDKELNQYLGLFLKGVEDGDSKSYRAALRALRGHTEKNMYGAVVNARAKKIASDTLLSQKAQAYFASKIINDHKVAIKDAETYFSKNFMQHADDYHEIKDISGKTLEKQIKNLGYEPLKKKDK